MLNADYNFGKSPLFGAHRKKTRGTERKNQNLLQSELRNTRCTLSNVSEKFKNSRKASGFVSAERHHFTKILLGGINTTFFLELCFSSLILFQI